MFCRTEKMKSLLPQTSDIQKSNSQHQIDSERLQPSIELLAKKSMKDRRWQAQTTVPEEAFSTPGWGHRSLYPFLQDKPTASGRRACLSSGEIPLDTSRYAFSWEHQFEVLTLVSFGSHTNRIQIPHVDRAQRMTQRVNNRTPVVDT